MLGSERARLLAALDLLQNWVSWPSEIGENTIDGRNPANHLGEMSFKPDQCAR